MGLETNTTIKIQNYVIQNDPDPHKGGKIFFFKFSASSTLKLFQ